MGVIYLINIIIGLYMRLRRPTKKPDDACSDIQDITQRYQPN